LHTFIHIKVIEISEFLNSNDYPNQRGAQPPLINGEYNFEKAYNNLSRYQGQNVVLLCLYFKFELEEKY
jgi:hypothetical protein